jgi:hypothetical protein
MSWLECNEKAKQIGILLCGVEPHFVSVLHDKKLGWFLDRILVKSSAGLVE